MVKKIFKLCVGGLLGLIVGVSLRLWFPVSDAASLGGVPVTAPRGSHPTLDLASPSTPPTVSGLEENGVSAGFYRQLTAATPENIRSLLEEACLAVRQDVGALARSMMEQLAKSNLEAAKQSLKHFPEGRLREQALRQLAGGVRQQGTTEEALAWIRQLCLPDYVRMLRARLLPDRESRGGLRFLRFVENPGPVPGYRSYESTRYL